MEASGFAVVDVETTGLFASSSHRIIEIAIVHVSAEGEITGSWETVLNPMRDLGAQRIHGIAAADVMVAPKFEQIAPAIAQLLQGRTFVAHNAAFDAGFLRAEFARLGARFDTRTICTMQLARTFIPGAGRSLQDCCDAYGIEIETAHRASSDALATAHLLSAYLAEAPTWEGWRVPALSIAIDPVNVGDNAWMPRRTHEERSASFFERITDKLPEFGGPADQLDYLALLDLALLDRQISAHEADALVGLAEGRGIDRTTVTQLHEEYFAQLVATAWSDGVLTEDEQADLVQVGTLLGVTRESIEAARIPRVVEEVPEVAFHLAAGDLVVLTGEMARPRDDWNRELETRGLVPWSAVTKKVKLVAAADPDSLSGKARKARDYGIPIVGERGLIALLGMQ